MGGLFKPLFVLSAAFAAWHARTAPWSGRSSSAILAHRAMDVPKKIALRALLTILEEYKRDSGEVALGDFFWVIGDIFRA